MRRAALIVAMVAVLGATGCHGGKSAYSATPTQDALAARDSATTTSAPASAKAATTSAGTAEAIAHGHFPGTAMIASGKPRISLAQAYQASHLGGGVLVSAVYLELPTTFMRNILSKAKKAKPTPAWVLSYTGVTSFAPSIGPFGHSDAGGLGAQNATQQNQTHVGNMTAIVDATSGEVLETTEY